MAESEWTIAKLMDWTRQYLARKGLSEPRLATELLLAHALGVRKIDLYTRFEQAVEPESLEKFRELVKRAADREPIAYIIGYREFFSLPFAVTREVLIPRPETETLVQEAIDLARRRMGWAGDARPGGVEPESDDTGEPAARATTQPSYAGLRIADIGTGSGAIAITLAIHLPGATVIATDISETALAVARRNAEANNAIVEFRAGAMFEPLAGEAKFDLICSNPPYIAADKLDQLEPEVRNYEPKAALTSGPTGLEMIEAIAAGAGALLAGGGTVLVEIGFNQSKTAADFFSESPDFSEVRTVRDSLGHERVIVATKKDGGQGPGIRDQGAEDHGPGKPAGT